MGEMSAAHQTVGPAQETAIVPDRLMGRIKKTTSRRMIWLYGVTGSGKSNLARQYADSSGVPCLWLHLDESIFDFSDFFRLLVSAARNGFSGCGQGTSEASVPEGSPETHRFPYQIRQVLSSFGIGPAILVFDSFHRVPAGSILPNIMGDFRKWLPAGFRVFVTSRKEPPIDLACLHRRGDMALFGADELWFTVDEARRVLAAVWPESERPMPREDFDQIYALTQGWPAGLMRLFALYAGNGGDMAAVMTTGRRLMVDQLAEEVPSSVWASRGLALLQEEADLDRRAWFGSRLLDYSLWKGEFILAGHVLDVLRAPVASCGHGAPRMEWFISAAFYHWACGDFAKARALLEADSCRSDGGGLHWPDFVPQLLSVAFSLADGDFAGAELALARISVVRMNSAWATLYHILGWIAAYRKGDGLRARGQALIALRLAGMSQMPVLEFFSHLVFALSARNDGQIALSQSHFEAAREIAFLGSNSLLRYCLDMMLARIAFEDSRDADGVKHLREALGASQRMGGIIWPWLGSDYWVPLYNKALDEGIDVPGVQESIRRMALVPVDPDNVSDLWPWPVRIFTLGRFEILVDGKPLAFNRKTQRRPLDLLKALIAFGARNVPDHHLAMAVWAEADDEGTPQQFKSTLHRLRSLLGDEESLVFRNSCLSLNPRRVWVDSLVFDRRIRRYRTPRTRQRESFIPEAALHLYRGEFLPEDNKPWILEPRERLRTRFRSAAESRVLELKQRGEFEPALRVCLDVLEIDPVAESLYVCAISCCGWLGRYAEATELYRRCRLSLLARLGVSPGHGTLAAYQEAIAVQPYSLAGASLPV